MYTPYNRDRQEFSDRGHKKSQSVVYPKLFNTTQDKLEFAVLDEEKAKMLDCEEATDRRVRATVTRLKGPLSFDFQERFRRPKFMDYQDITMTEWNYNSNLPSELYKIRAHLFLYGYYDPTSDTILEAIVFHVSPILLQIAHGKLAYRRGTNNKNQSFLTITFDELKRSGAVAFHMRGDEVL